MKITFELVNEQYISIIADGKKVGHIFSPSGSGEDVTNAIQVCGFEEAFDLWGCGVFGEETSEEVILKSGTYKKSNYIMKKDIQLLFKAYDKANTRGSMNWDCKCYNKPCTCEVKDQRIPYIVKWGQDLKLEKKSK